MRVVKIIVLGMFAAIFFTGFFAVFAAAEGTSFDDAKVIGEGTYIGNVTSEYYYKITIPGYKALLVTLQTESGSKVSLQIYDSNRKEISWLWGWDHAQSENGEIDTAFYDGEYSQDYVAYIKVKNLNYQTIGRYKITIEFRPGDVMSGAQSISDGTTVSDEIKHPAEIHWYKISVPKGELLNITYSTKGGKITVTLYDSKGNYIDLDSGQVGYVSTEALGETGTIYIKVESYEFPSHPIEYSFTPHLKSGVSAAGAGAFSLGTCCIGGIVIIIVVIVAIVIFLVKRSQQNSEPKKSQNQPPPPPPS